MVLDASLLKPQREEGQHALSTLMLALGKLGITSMQVVTTSPLTRLQLVRIGNESSVREILQFLPNGEAATKKK